MCVWREMSRIVYADVNLICPESVIDKSNLVCESHSMMSSGDLLSTTGRTPLLYDFVCACCYCNSLFVYFNYLCDIIFCIFVVCIGFGCNAHCIGKLVYNASL